MTGSTIEQAVFYPPGFTARRYIYNPYRLFFVIFSFFSVDAFFLSILIKKSATPETEYFPGDVADFSLI
ncbi:MULTISPECIES: hypothetical protein [Tenebrionibacter/Tenebrionicola group]|jgi:hypothetical protein|uniref:Uncharacterized protein n=2 Tax=Tenebrionibacter/Tenebrionicola group TaxID=2969848 RepID=A0A8K0XX93_9ENTR|nr:MULTISPECIES: hypothetical protein [Tenebrionibacter/Tenebrionicola group]MBK4716355.1 hypothetical protein [Tenebrionibacter intestinalis]MBV5097132.1 hypothetical protein [Tenebrionicola larvae]